MSVNHTLTQTHTELAHKHNQLQQTVTNNEQTHTQTLTQLRADMTSAHTQWNHTLTNSVRTLNDTLNHAMTVHTHKLDTLAHTFNTSVQSELTHRLASLQTHMTAHTHSPK
jgi:DNA anti-recombination protein RmuC